MSKYLSQINRPEDLKELTVRELSLLAREIRQEIIKVVSRRGGHLASSLGVVELTIALYYVFDLGRDKIVWDVGHQTYAHKLLTGRRKIFNSLRQFKGISGFPKISESPYDFYGTGHASTSLSAALGIAVARDRRGGREKIIACLGDGALTGGLALEALNQGALCAKDILVVLNANEMAISPSVGAFPQYLSRILSTPAYNRLNRDIKLLLEKIPALGSRMVEAGHRLAEAVKGLITPGVIFEELGYLYFGPVDGHDLESLVKILNNIKSIREPVFLHVVTRKGKGYPPAEGNPEQFHGAEPFHIGTGKPRHRKKFLSYSEVFGEALVNLAEKDKRIVAITAAMCRGTGLIHFARRFPDRFFDVGIAEGHALTFAAGMASQGLKPVIAIYSTFLQRGYDQIVHDICLQKLPVVLAVDRAGLVGEDGPTHHGTFDIAYLRHIPNLIIMQPRSGKELTALLATALSIDGPSAIRYGRGKSKLTMIDPDFAPLPLGRAELISDGRDGLLWATGEMVRVAEEAAGILHDSRLDFGVVNARFIKPLDNELLVAAARKGKRIATLEEHVLAGGLGSAVWECLEKEGFGQTKILRLGIPDRFIQHGPIASLREICGLTPNEVADRIKKWCRG